jgi:hypothetical protein
MGLGATKNFARYSIAQPCALEQPRRRPQIAGDDHQKPPPRRAGVIGLDDTIECRWGPKTSAGGIYRAIRCARPHVHFVKTSGLRWLSVMALVPVPWTKRRWGLPFLTILAPSERYEAAHRHRPTRS